MAYAKQRAVRRVLTLLLPALSACSEPAEDGIDDPFLVDGKSDTGGVVDGSPEALGVLRLVNEVSLQTLDDDVGLLSNAASGIVNHRAGGDGTDGTADDDSFDDLAELDAIPYVGPVAFVDLLDYARSNGYVVAADVDFEWSAWPMPSDNPLSSSYVVSGGVVTDLVTGLEWQQSVPSSMFWGEADSYCNKLSLDGAGWRLPTIIELASIVSFGTHNPGINTTVFPDTPSDWFWSSTRSFGAIETRWAVHFSWGLSQPTYTGGYQNAPPGSGLVRCVRSQRTGSTGDGGAPPGRYVAAAETVLDTVAGLTWQRTAAVGMPKAAAATYCSALNLGGTTSWRLPTIKELHSLVDVRAGTPAIDTVAFPDTPPGGFYYSASSWIYDVSKQWTLSISQGTNGYGSVPYYAVRCVH